MAWEVLGRTYYNDSDLTDTTVFQSIKFDYNVAIRALKLWVIVFNDPTFTSLNLKVYANNENAATNQPSSLLATADNTWAKADLHTQDYAAKEIYFEFANDLVLGGDSWYHVALNATGYSGASETSHLSWMYAYPNIYYSEGVTLSKVTASTYPLALHPIFSEFNKQ